MGVTCMGNEIKPSYTGIAGKGREYVGYHGKNRVISSISGAKSHLFQNELFGRFWGIYG
jgi:hypothetical protein